MTALCRMLVLIAIAIAIAGCEPPKGAYELPPAPASPAVTGYQPPPIPPAPFSPPNQVKPAPALVRALPGGRSVQGRTIAATALGSGGTCVMFIGGIHGNEKAGVPLCEKLEAYLKANPELLIGLKVVIIPNANPDGIAANTRGNANGVDINRNFATGNYSATATHGSTAMSQPEARYLRGLIDRHRPARIITLHQPLSCIDYDGPGLDLAKAISGATGLPVKKLGARPGSLGSYAGVENKIPTITVEFPAGATNLTAEQVWSKYGRAMLAALSYGQGAVAK